MIMRDSNRNDLLTREMFGDESAIAVDGDLDEIYKERRAEKQ